MHPAIAKSSIQALGASKIREVANAGMGRHDTLAFWFGEPDGVTPDFIRAAAKAALDQGDTFYQHNLGIEPLRSGLATYLNQCGQASRAPIDWNRVIVTSAGVNALMLAAQSIIGAGDEVVAIVPVWPNLTEIPAILGAKVKRVSLHFDVNFGWQLDFNRLIDAITPNTRAVIINSPNNPSGWMMNRDQQAKLLAHCRSLGTWILSDEAYDRLVFEPGLSEHLREADTKRQAPSLLDHAHADDRVIVANTFSKTWQMTGWRLGWLVVPTGLIDSIGKLIEFNTSCAPGFVQQAGLIAVEKGEASTQSFVAQLQTRRDYLASAIKDHSNLRARLQLVAPPAAMYLFFRVAGLGNSLAFCKRLVSDFGLGLAPGIAFGSESEGFIRWCFAKDTALLEQGVDRLAKALK